MTDQQERNIRVVCTICGQGGAGPRPPYNCVGKGGCGGKATMVPIYALDSLNYIKSQEKTDDH